MSFHLVCFGDSLTAGYQSGSGFGGGVDTPYGSFLQSWLGGRGRVTVSGVCGELTQEMVARFPSDVVGHQPEAVVILGGTNDLGSGLMPDVIMKNLEWLYRQGKTAGIQVVGVTVPSLYVTHGLSLGPEESASQEPLPLPGWVESHIAHRRTLNDMIHETCGCLGLSCVDLFRGTKEGGQDLLAPRYSNDGLHLSTLGYEQFARLVWHTFLEDQFGSPVIPEGLG